MRLSTLRAQILLVLLSILPCPGAHAGEMQGTDLHGDPLPPGAVARYGTLRLRHGTGARQVFFSSDGKLLASIGSADMRILVWDVGTGKLHRELLSTSAIQTATVAPGSTMLVSGHRDRTIHFWDMVSGKELRRLAAQTGGIAALAVSPDGRTLASGCDRHRTTSENPDLMIGTGAEAEDTTIALWDVATGKSLGALAGHTQSVAALRFLADGKRLVSGSKDGTLRLWDLAMRTTIQRTEETLASVSEVHDLGSDQVVTRGWKDNKQILQFWNIKDGKEVFWLGPNADAHVCAVARDRAMLFVASAEAIALLCPTPASRVNDLQIPAGRLLASPAHRTASCWPQPTRDRAFASGQPPAVESSFRTRSTMTPCAWCAFFPATRRSSPLVTDNVTFGKRPRASRNAGSTLMITASQKARPTFRPMAGCWHL